MIRDVNADGLGDRRGVALERVDVPRYRPGTLDQIGTRRVWTVYRDGRVRFRSTSEEDAREWAQIEEARGWT